LTNKGEIDHSTGNIYLNPRCIAPKKNNAMTIPQIIISQILSLDNLALSAYGSKNFYSIDESSEYQGGLGFSVNGLHHKGEVKILLKWIDVYEIQFLKRSEIIKQYDDVYCDMLVEILDYIEFGTKD
jgi:hypothetical protein